MERDSFCYCVTTVYIRLSGSDIHAYQFRTSEKYLLNFYFKIQYSLHTTGNVGAVQVVLWFSSLLSGIIQIIPVAYGDTEERLIECRETFKLLSYCNSPTAISWRFSN